MTNKTTLTPNVPAGQVTETGSLLPHQQAQVYTIGAGFDPTTGVKLGEMIVLSASKGMGKCTYSRGHAGGNQGYNPEDQHSIREAK